MIAANMFAERRGIFWYSDSSVISRWSICQSLAV